MTNLPSLIICIESCLCISIFFGLDTYRRASKELKRKKWEQPLREFPNWTWYRVTIDYLLFIITIIISYFIDYNKYIHYIFAFLLTCLIQPDWYQLEIETGYIRIAYDSLSDRDIYHKYWARAVCIFASIVVIIVYIIYCINPNEILSLDLFIIIQVSISLIIMIPIGIDFYYHTRLGHLNSVSVLRTGKNRYLVWLERFYYHAVYYWIRIICHIVLIAIFVLNISMNNESLNKFVDDNICITFGVVLQVWFFGYYYLFMTNRCNIRCCKKTWERYGDKSYESSRAWALQRHKSEIGAI